MRGDAMRHPWSILSRQERRRYDQHRPTCGIERSIWQQVAEIACGNLTNRMERPPILRERAKEAAGIGQALLGSPFDWATKQPGESFCFGGLRLGPRRLTQLRKVPPKTRLEIDLQALSPTWQRSRQHLKKGAEKGCRLIAQRASSSKELAGGAICLKDGETASGIRDLCDVIHGTLERAAHRPSNRARLVEVKVAKYLRYPQQSNLEIENPGILDTGESLIWSKRDRR